MHFLRIAYLKIDNRILYLTFTVQYSAAILQQNLYKIVQNYATLCIIESNKNKDLGIFTWLGVRVVDSSNLFAPTNEIKDLQVCC
jgi:hypothetical protein